MKRDRFEDFSCALALGLPRREVLKRLGAWIGVSVIVVVLPRRLVGKDPLEAEAAEKSSGGASPTPQFQVNGTALPGFGAGQDGPILQIYCDANYCYTQRLNPTGQPQMPNGIPFMAPVDFGAPQYQVNGAVLSLPATLAVLPFSSPQFQLNGSMLPLPPASTVIPLSAPLGGYCDLDFCYTVHTNSGQLPFQLNGTLLQVNGTVIQVNGTTFQVNSTRIQVNGTPVQVNGTGFRVNSTTIQLNGTSMPSAPTPPRVSINATSVVPFPVTIPPFGGSP